MTSRWLLRPQLDSDVLSIAAVSRQLGVPQGEDPGAGFVERVMAAQAILTQHARPAAVVCRMTRESWLDCRQEMEMDAVVTRVAETASDCLGFVVTLGACVDEALRELMAAGEMSAALVLDAAATLVVEAAADSVERFCEQQTSAVLNHGLRYSPGYCGWPAEGQQTLFRELAAGEIGVILCDGGRMEPVKTISGIVLINDPGVHQQAGRWDICQTCQRIGCRQDTFAKPVNGLSGGEHGRRT